MFDDMSPAEFARRRDAGELWQLLDVRERWETVTASVSGSILIPMGEIVARHGELDMSTPLAVLCHSGIRSASVAGYLARAGFSRVVNIAGGIDAWSLSVDNGIPRY